MQYIYVYKIVGKFTNENFDKFLVKLNKNFVYAYIDKTLFVASKQYQESAITENILHHIFRPTKDFYIEDINQSNIQLLSPTIKDWCTSHIMRLHTQYCELVNQEKLQQMWLAMNKLEENLQLQSSQL